MENIYMDADLLSVYKQRRKYLHIFYAMTISYLATAIALCIYHSSLPYGSPLLTWPKIAVYAISVLYVVAAFPFMAIKYRRVNRYHRMLSYINEGIKVEETNYFVVFRTQTQQQDNVDVIVCVFGEWNKRRQEWREREVYLDAEKPLPEFGNGDLVHYITQSNFLVHYEIIQRHAYDFAMLDTDTPHMGVNADETAD